MVVQLPSIRVSFNGIESNSKSEKFRVRIQRFKILCVHLSQKLWFKNKTGSVSSGCIKNCGHLSKWKLSVRKRKEFFSFFLLIRWCWLPTKDNTAYRSNINQTLRLRVFSCIKNQATSHWIILSASHKKIVYSIFYTVIYVTHPLYLSRKMMLHLLGGGGTSNQHLLVKRPATDLVMV